MCSYSCLYCQVGPTIDRTVEPRAFYAPSRIASEVAGRVDQLRAHGESIDYVTFVPDGEPTLDAGLGEAIGLIRPLGTPIAVISNGSLLWRPDVRDALGGADWVSVKVDAGDEATWMRLNRPHPDLEFTRIREGIARFAGEYGGELVTETMLVDGVNDSSESIAAVAELLADLGASRTYLAIPTRPTPYPNVIAPDEGTVNRAYQLMVGRLPSVEYLVGYEGDEFASTGDPKADLLAITAVHPMRASAVGSLLERSGASWEVVQELIDEGDILEVGYRNERFYSRRWRR